MFTKNAGSMLRLNNGRKNSFFLAIVLDLHYLCPKELKPLINLLFRR